MSKFFFCDKKYGKFKTIEWDFVNSKQSPITAIHPYPAKFISDIPHALINLLGSSRSTTVLDPFCGSGTTLLAAAEMGYNAYGVDLNPIACLISKCKLNFIPTNYLETAKKITSHAIDNNSVAIKKIPNLDHWFSKDVQEGIESLVFEIEKQKGRMKDFLFLALSSIIVRVSRQESDTRYAAIQKNIRKNDVYKLFQKSCEKIYKSKKEQSVKSRHFKIFQKDILKIKDSDFPEKIGLVITSPPYPNAYEYWLYHKYRMWWLGYDPIAVRQSEIGARPHYQKKNGLTENDFENQMNSVFELFDKIVVDDGHICFVVGRSIIRGKEIDNSEIVIRAAQKNNFVLKVNIERAISANKKAFNQHYGKIKTENILVFSRS